MTWVRLGGQVPERALWVWPAMVKKCEKQWVRPQPLVCWHAGTAAVMPGCQLMHFGPVDKQNVHPGLAPTIGADRVWRGVQARGLALHVQPPVQASTESAPAHTIDDFMGRKGAWGIWPRAQ